MFQNIALQNLLLAFAARDKFTVKHCERVTETAVKIGYLMGVADDGLNDLMIAGYLHDIGKIAIPTSILYKPGSLTVHEWSYIREHPVISGQLTAHLGDPIHKAVLCHHERFDGVGGYPFGFAGDDIPLYSRILSVADAFDAMKFGRVYKDPLTNHLIYRDLRKEKNRQFDPCVVDAFFEVLWADQAETRSALLPSSLNLGFSHAAVA